MIVSKLYKNIIIEKPRFTFVILLIILLTFGYFTKFFQLDASSDTLLLENDPDLKYLREVNKKYGSKDFLVLTYTHSPSEDLNFKSEDTIKNLKSTIVSKQDLINNQNKKLTSLENQITSLKNNLTESSEKEDQISFIGINLTKSNYNLIVWIIIFTILSLLVYFIYRFKNSNILTKETRSSFDEIEQEFEQYKKKSIEKEQQLRRKLQDEINKQRGV